MNADRRHGIPRLGTQAFITHGNNTSRLLVFSLIIWAQPPQSEAKRVKWHLYIQWVTLQESNSELREANFYNGQ